MKKKDFLLLIDNLLTIKPGTLTGEETLQDLSMWDSLAILGFISLVDKEFHVVLSVDAINAAKTVNDLLSLLEDKVQ